MPGGHSLHRSVSFTDTDPLWNNLKLPSLKIDNTMSHPAQLIQSAVAIQHQHQGHLQRSPVYTRRSPKVVAGSVSYLTCLALMSEVFALVPFVVAYAAPYWMQVSDPMGLTFSGLWRLCAYTYCEYFIGHPMHTWFHTVQVCSSLALLCQVFSFVLTCIYAFSCGCLRYKPHLIWTAATALVIADVLQLSSVVLYGVYQGADPGTLSWAFLLAALCTGFTILPIIFLVMEAAKLFRKKQKKHPILHRSVSAASIVSKEVAPANSEISKSTKDASSNQIQIQSDRTRSLVRMRVNSSSTLLSDQNDIPGCYDNSILDNSVFD